MLAPEYREGVQEIGPERAEDFDRFLEASDQADILQSFAWGELKRRTGWQPIRLAALDERGRIHAAVSVLKHPFPLGGCFLYVPRGPVADYEDQRRLGAVFDALEAIARREGAVFLKVDPPIARPAAEALSFLRGRGYRRARQRRHWGGVQPVAVCRLDLRGSEEDVLARFHPKTRYNIRLAERQGVQVRQGGRDDLPLFQAILEETAARQNFGVRSLQYYLDLWDHFAPGGHMELWLGEQGGDVLAGALTAAWGPNTYYLYGGSRSLRREVMPAYAVQWQAIRRALERGAKVYDFLGVSAEMDPADPLYGLYRFKRGFRPAYVEWLGEFDLPLARGRYRIWNLAEPLYIKGMSRLHRLRRRVKELRRVPRTQG